MGECVKGLGGSGHALAFPAAKSIMITCQHEWVKQCRLRYRCEPPTGYHFEKAHYPLSEKQGGTNTVLLWYPDHIVQGVLQTLGTNYPCIHTPKYKAETQVLSEVYPEYLSLYWEAYKLCKTYASKKAFEEKDENGKSVNAVRAGRSCGKQHAENKTGVCGLSLEHIREAGRKGGLISGPLNVENRKGIHSPEWYPNRSAVSKEVAKKNVEEKRGVHSDEWKNSEECRKQYVLNGERLAEKGVGIHTPESRRNAGILAAAVTNSQKWVDPDHPELGEHSAPTLSQMQRRRGYPHGKENRVRKG